LLTAAAKDPAALCRTELTRSRAACALLLAVAAGSDVPIESLLINTPYRIGKYTLSPQTISDDHGRYRASLSIKSGLGSQVCDRVFRFAPTFDTPDEAASFVDEQAQAWLASRLGAAIPSMERAHG
jgi:hypothetical protein